jgi:hypothetical protein
MLIELPSKTREKIVHLLQQRQIIEEQINTICTTILDVEKIETDTFKLNNEITHIECDI